LDIRLRAGIYRGDAEIAEMVSEIRNPKSEIPSSSS